MELVTVPGQTTQSIELENRIVGTGGGFGQFVVTPVNVTTKAADSTAIMDPDDNRLTVQEITAKIQALEAQIEDLRKQDNSLQLERATALKEGKSTAELSVKQFDIRQNISALCSTLEGLKIATVSARQRQAVSAFEETTANLLGSKNDELKAYNALVKAQAHYQSVLSSINALRNTYEAKRQELKVNHHLSQAEIDTRGQLTLVNEFGQLVDQHKQDVKPGAKAFPFSRPVGSGLVTVEADPMPDVSYSDLPAGMQRPGMPKAAGE